MWSDFKKFLFKGNMINLAVGVVICAAFTAIVTALVTNIIMPLVGIVTGGTNFAGLTLTVGQANLTYGAFIEAVINFILIAIIVFLLVKFIYKITKTEEKESRKCPFCFMDIDDNATRCPYCTSLLEVVSLDDDLSPK